MSTVHSLEIPVQFVKTLLLILDVRFFKAVDRKKGLGLELPNIKE